MYKKIAVGLDLESNSDAPLITGLRIAQEFDAQLDIVCVIRQALLATKGFFNAEFVDKKQLVDEARRAFDTRLGRLTAQTLGSHFATGKASERIAQVAKHQQCDLVVIGARPRSRSETIFGTTATNILREARDIDIYACHRTDPHAPLEQVVVAVDGSAITPQVFSEVGELLRTAMTKHQPTVRVVGVASDLADKDHLADKCIAYLGASALREQPFQVVHGGVVERLEHLVERFDTDLLVIGSGNNFGPSWYVGSTTNNILHECASDVLVIRPNS